MELEDFPIFRVQLLAKRLARFIVSHFRDVRIGKERLFHLLHSVFRFFFCQQKSFAGLLLFLPLLFPLSERFFHFPQPCRESR